MATAKPVNKMQTTVDAANLAKMADRGQIRGGVVAGPLGPDNAIAIESAEIRGIPSPMAGRADIPIAPSVKAGNLLAKAITYSGHGELAGVVVGGCAPTVAGGRPAPSGVTSRSASRVTKLVSMALVVLPASPAYGTVQAS